MKADVSVCEKLDEHSCNSLETNKELIGPLHKCVWGCVYIYINANIDHNYCYQGG